MIPKIGQRWERITPAGDEWDALEIAGFAQGCETVPDEWICRAVDGLEVVSVNSDDLQKVFKLASEPPDTPTPELGRDALESWL